MDVFDQDPGALMAFVERWVKRHGLDWEDERWHAPFAEAGDQCWTEDEVVAVLEEQARVAELNKGTK